LKYDTYYFTQFKAFSKAYVIARHQFSAFLPYYYKFFKKQFELSGKAAIYVKIEIRKNKTVWSLS